MVAVLQVQGVPVRTLQGKNFCTLEFQMEEGESVGIAATGVANLKATMRMLAGVSRPAAGEIIWNGLSSTTIHQAPSRGAAYRLIQKQRLDVGFFTSAGSLMNDLSLFDNVALPLRYHLHLPESEVARKVHKLLNLFKVEHEAFERPAGLNEGVRRRAELARVFALEPPLVILDSPLIDIDRDSSDIIVDALRQHREESQTALLVATSHPESIMGLVSRMILLHDDKAITLECDVLNDESLWMDARRLESVVGERAER